MIARILAILLVLVMSPAAALQVTVRSGEHADFSRLVFLLPSQTKWSLIESGTDFRVSFDRTDLTFDFSDVFRYIPKDRIRSISQVDPASSVLIEAGDDIRAEAFELSSGAVVVDFVTSPQTAPLRTLAAPKKIERAPGAPESYLSLYWRDRSDEKSKTPSGQSRTTTIALPDPRVQQAERELVAQLARAAAQGLIRLDMPSPPATSASERKRPSQKEHGPATVLPLPNDHIAIRSETAIDRDTFSAGMSDDLTGQGQRCYPDGLFNIAEWLENASPAEQIGKARRDLVGEFDTPNPDAVLNLARTYLALSFGVEAWHLAQTMDSSSEATEAIRFMASVIDSNPVAPDSPILSMANCDGDVAMWALLGASDQALPDSVRFGAVQRAFSSLPYIHRKLFGPDLVRKLIDLGAPDVAESIRSALARAPENPGNAMDLMDARLEVAAGAAQEAEKHLEPVINENTNHASEAIVLYINERIRRGEPIDDATTENAGALAFELRDSDEGLALLRAHSLGLGSVGRFTEAFSALEKWPAQRQTTLKETTVSDLFQILSVVPDDQLFLKAYYAHKRQAAEQGLRQPVRNALAARLITLGFATSAREVLGPDALHSEQGRILLARAALAERDAPATLAHLSEISAPEASQLRGKALQMLGEHAAAKNEFLKTGDVVAETTEAWRSADWQTIAVSGSAAEKNFLAAFDLDPRETAASESIDPETTGMLARSRALIEKSQSQREALQALLQELETPR